MMANSATYQREAAAERCQYWLNEAVKHYLDDIDEDEDRQTCLRMAEREAEEFRYWQREELKAEGKGYWAFIVTTPERQEVRSTNGPLTATEAEALWRSMARHWPSVVYGPA